jgi:putative phage-type endonuclease
VNDSLRREQWAITSQGEWLDRRRQAVTASRIGAVFGVHPFMDMQQLSGDLRGASVKGDTLPMKLGRILEPAVAAAYAEEHPEARLVKADSYHWLPEHRIGASPDYWIDDDGVLECKTTSVHQWERWHGTIPLHYILQLLVCLMVTDRPRGVLACMIRGGSFSLHEYTVSRHPAAEQRIIDAVAAFWRAYDANEIAAPAPVDELEAMLDTGEHRDLSNNAEMRAMLEERRDIKASMSVAAQRLGEIEYAIKNTIGPASTAWLEGWNITFKRYHRAEYTVPARDVRMLKIREIRETIGE